MKKTIVKILVLLLILISIYQIFCYADVIWMPEPYENETDEQYYKRADEELDKQIKSKEKMRKEQEKKLKNEKN